MLPRGTLQTALAVAAPEVAGALVRRVSGASKGLLFELPVESAPGSALSQIIFYAWPDPPGIFRAALLDVVRLDDCTLDPPLSFAFDLRTGSLRPRAPTPPARPPPPLGDAASSTSVWAPAPPPDQLPAPTEPVGFSPRGRLLYRTVDTATHSRQFTCACGRVRFVRPNSTHQVSLCHPCARQAHLRRRALAQFRRPKQRTRVACHLEPVQLGGE